MPPSPAEESARKRAEEALGSERYYSPLLEKVTEAILTATQEATEKEKKRIIEIIKGQQVPRLSPDTVTETMWNHVCEKLIDAIKAKVE